MNRIAMCSSSSLEGGGWLVSTQRHRTTSNLIWGKPGLEGQAEGVYDASSPPPTEHVWKRNRTALQVTETAASHVRRQAQRGSFVTSGTDLS